MARLSWLVLTFSAGFMNVKPCLKKKPEGHYFLIRHIMLLRLSMVIPQKTILYELQNKN